MKGLAASFCLSAVLLSAALASDVSLIFPPGGNNKLRNQGDRFADNEQRLFWSDTTRSSGATTPTDDSTFYAGSKMEIAWMDMHGAQHGFGNTTYVIQMLCDSDAPNLRNGDREGGFDAENTYDRDSADATPPNDIRGRHESASNILDCVARERNGGLWTADETVEDTLGAACDRQLTFCAIAGTECIEERNYYPYWHPSPWRDIAVVTTNTERCELYQAQSQNVVNKGFCDDPAFNNELDCENNGDTWAEDGSFGIDAPACVEAAKAPYNGYGDGAPLQTFSWTVPEPPSGSEETCVIRIRANMTSNLAWYAYGKENWALTSEDNGESAYFNNNPELLVNSEGEGLEIGFSGSTDSFVTEDRSYTFKIAPAPDNDCEEIHNLGLIGDVRIYHKMNPGLAFHPNRIFADKGDCVHIQLNPPGGLFVERVNLVPSKFNDLAQVFPAERDEQDMFDDATYNSLALLGEATDVENFPGGYYAGELVKFDTNGEYNYLSTTSGGNRYFPVRGRISVGVEPPASDGAGLSPLTKWIMVGSSAFVILAAIGVIFWRLQNRAI